MIFTIFTVWTKRVTNQGPNRTTCWTKNVNCLFRTFLKFILWLTDIVGFGHWEPFVMSVTFASAKFHFPLPNPKARRPIRSSVVSSQHFPSPRMETFHFITATNPHHYVDVGIGAAFSPPQPNDGNNWSRRSLKEKYWSFSIHFLSISFLPFINRALESTVFENSIQLISRTP